MRLVHAVHPFVARHLSRSPLNTFNFRFSTAPLASGMIEEVQPLLQHALGCLASIDLGSLSRHGVPIKFSNSTGPQRSSSDIRLKPRPVTMPSVVTARMLPVLEGCPTERPSIIRGWSPQGRSWARAGLKELGLRTPALASTSAFLSSSVPPSCRLHRCDLS